MKKLFVLFALLMVSTVGNAYHNPESLRHYIRRHNTRGQTPKEFHKELRWKIEKSIEVATRCWEFETIVNVKFYDDNMIQEEIAQLRKEGYKVSRVSTTEVDFKDENYYSNHGTVNLLKIHW